MLFWIFAAVFAAASMAALAGWLLFRYACGRSELPEGWEKDAVEKRNDPVLSAATEAGLRWLERRETEEAEVQSGDGLLLSGVFLPHIAPRATMILFHDWRSSWEFDFLCLLPFLYGEGIQLLLVDERAQGDSEGSYMTLGVREREDVSAWVSYAARRLGPTHPIFLGGLSMGASAVLMSASEKFEGNVRGIIADSGYTSPYDIVSLMWRNRTPFPAGFSMWVLDRFTRFFAGFGLKDCSTTEVLARANYPVLLIHGEQDASVPAYMSKRACEACRSGKTLLLIEGAGHGMSYLTDRDRVEDAVRTFVERHLA